MGTHRHIGGRESFVSFIALTSMPHSRGIGNHPPYIHPEHVRGHVPGLIHDAAFGGVTRSRHLRRFSGCISLALVDRKPEHEQVGDLVLGRAVGEFQAGALIWRGTTRQPSGLGL